MYMSSNGCLVPFTFASKSEGLAYREGGAGDNFPVVFALTKHAATIYLFLQTVGEKLAI